jgi:cobalt-precorrin 5A hydrolase/precorrin-3B C17-methyltransferase
VSEIITVSITEGGRRLAEQLPYERRHGGLAATVREAWERADALVIVAALGAVVRVIAPLLSEKHADPAIVCIDERGSHVIAVVGGHARGANELARSIAATIGAIAVVTTATDAVSAFALDQVPGLACHGDVAGVTAAMLGGGRPRLERRLPWPLPDGLIAATEPALTGEDAGPRVVVTAERIDDEPGTVVLVPPAIIAGIGTSTDATPNDVGELLEHALMLCGLDRRAVAAVATIDRRRHHPAVVSLGLPIISFTAATLAEVDVPSPSGTVERTVGTPSVAEAAALLASGPGGGLVLEKHTSPRATVSLSRRSVPPGAIALVGLGPGGPALRVPAAATALRRADTVIGFHAYLDQCRDVLTTSQDVIGSPIGDEVGRACRAVERALAGQVVAVVCSGDAGVYAMASLVLEELGERDDVDVQVVPGVTAALAAAALLGAPLGHDHLVLSLSDLLTPWELIESRARAAADTDLVLALYNPRSRQRHWQLGAVRDLLLERRPATTPVGIVTDAGRPGESVVITTLAELDPELVGMTSCVIVGSSTTRLVGGRMVTPRGYRRQQP